MTSVPSIADAVTELAGKFSGQLLQPTDAGYEEARKVHNGLVNKHPALIARCRGVADVIDAVDLARRLNLEVAVRGGGHNVAGRATVEGGLMIDLMPMKGIHVDPKARTVQAQGGVTWAELNRETQLHGLAVTGGVVSTTGIAGLTLGGGIGWLMFWAVRGGGGNFGVATSFEYQLHQVGPTITGGLIAHPFDRARDVLRFARDFATSLPDEFMVFAGLIHAPDGSGTKLAAIVACHCGSLAEGETAMRPLKQFGQPLMDAIGPMPYCQLNAMLDGAFPKGAPNGPAASRALPRRGNPRRGQRHGVPAPRGRLQPYRALRMDGAERYRSLHRMGAGNVRSDGALRWLRPLCKLLGRR